MVKMDPAPATAAPTPAVAIGSKAVPQPAKGPTAPATGIGEWSHFVAGSILLQFVVLLKLKGCSSIFQDNRHVLHAIKHR